MSEVKGGGPEPPPHEANLVANVLVAFVLHALANRRADQRTGQRMVTIDQSAGGCAHERATGLAIVLPVVRRGVDAAPMMSRDCKSRIRGDKQCQKEHRGPKFSRK